MSARSSSSPRAASCTALAPRRSASCAARPAERLATQSRSTPRERRFRAASSPILPAPTSRTDRFSMSSKTRAASSAAADETDAGFSPMLVSRRTRLPTCSAWRKRRCRTGPTTPAFSAVVVRAPHLAEDLRLAGDEGVEPGRHAEEVKSGLPILLDVQRASSLRAAGPTVRRAQRQSAHVRARHRPRRRRGRLGCRSTGRPPRRVRRPVGPSAPRCHVVEREPFPQLDRRVTVDVPTRRRRVISGSHVGDDGRAEANGDDEREAGERDVRGAAAMPACLVAKDEERRVDHPRGKSHGGHDRVERPGHRLEACEADADADGQRGRAAVTLRPMRQSSVTSDGARTRNRLGERRFSRRSCHRYTAARPAASVKPANAASTRPTWNARKTLPSPLFGLLRRRPPPRRGRGAPLPAA